MGFTEDWIPYKPGLVNWKSSEWENTINKHQNRRNKAESKRYIRHSQKAEICIIRVLEGRRGRMGEKQYLER